MAKRKSSQLLTSVQIRKVLRKWHDLEYTESALMNLYLVRKAIREIPQSLHYAVNQVIAAAITRLATVNARASELLTLRFIDRHPVAHCARHFNVSESNFFAMQSDAVKQLGVILHDMDSQAWSTQKVVLEGRLEAQSNPDLIGVEAHIKALSDQLCRTDAPWLIAVEGLGGIGKTSLANATVRRLIDQRAFDEVGWVTARTKRLNLGGHIVSGVEPALSAQDLIESLTYQLIPHYAQVQHTQSEPLLTLLHRKLKAVPHLIVIDNLETLVDVEALLPTLQELANPTKFLLTSREALFSTPNIYHFKVPELDSANALALVRQEIAVSNLTALASWRDDELLPIIDTVGGNPLALRLVIGQAHVHDVDAILEQLRLAKGEPAENLYTYIYRHAWQSLTELEQKVLLLMPVVNPDGDELSFIADVSDFPIEQIRKTLNRLVTLSLVDVLESEHQYRYRIHGLTRTFLHDEILKW